MSLMLHRAGLLRPSVGAPVYSVPDAFEVADWSIVRGNGEASITIDSLPGNGGATITNIEYRLDGGSWVSAGTTGNFSIPSLTNGTEYDVELRAMNAIGAGAASDAKSVTPAAVPAAFGSGDWSIAPGDEEADVTINSLPSNGGATITGIEYQIDGGSWVSAGTTSNFSIPSLTNGTEYDVELRAVNAIGAGAASDAKSVTPATVPAAFSSGDWSIAPGDEEADVTINSLPGNGGATITDIEFRLDGGSWVSTGGTTSFTIFGLTNDQEYDVDLHALNSVGAGAASDTKQVKPEGSGAWHPNDLSSPPLAIWDPTVSGSLWQNTAGSTAAGDGDPIGRIDDQSANGNHLLQSTDTKRPLFDIISGAPWVVCDGVDDGMAFTNIKPAMVAAVFWIADPGTSALALNSLFTRAENGYNNSIRLVTDAPRNRFRTTGVEGNTDDYVFNDGETRINGALTSSFAYSTPSIITAKGGTNNNQSTEGLGGIGLPEWSGRQWRGRWGRVVLLSAVPDSGEYANLLAWLAEPYGISV